jgi:hypothetical protein
MPEICLAWFDAALWQVYIPGHVKSLTGLSNPRNLEYREMEDGSATYAEGNRRLASR